VGDYVYLETSAMRHTPILAPLRSGPYKVTRILAGGNSIGLEGFRHPFHVELLTPVYCYADGSTPHLTKHQLDIGQNTQQEPEHISQDPELVQERLQEEHLELDVDIHAETETPDDPDPVHTQEQVEQAVQEFLQDSEEVWDFNPHVRIVPTTHSTPTSTNIVRHAPDVDATILTSDIGTVETSKDILPTDIPAHVILPDQLPGNIVKILQQRGRSLNSAMLTCLCDNGIQCRITFRQLASILGSTTAKTLLHTLPNPPEA
jgi:hypothetical protein